MVIRIGDDGDGIAIEQDDDLWDEEEPDEEWREGECDHCYGEAVDGPLGTIYCACQIGLGASEDECECGPPEGDEQ